MKYYIRESVNHFFISESKSFAEEHPIITEFDKPMIPRHTFIIGFQNLWMDGFYGSWQVDKSNIDNVDTILSKFKL